MNMRKGTTVLVIALTLLLTACGGGSETDSNLGSGYVGGQEGLQFEFGRQAPPDEVFDRGQASFDVFLEVENLGEDRVNMSEVTVSLKGFTPSEFGLTPDDRIQQPEDDLEPVRQAGDNVIDGGRTTVEWPRFNFSQEATTGRTITFQAEACYDYKTRATGQLCVLEDLFQIDDDDPFCDVNDPSLPYSSSGAPVQVVGMSQDVTGRDRIQFDIEVQNVGSGQQFGGGEIFPPGANCEGLQEENKAIITVNGLPNAESIECLNGQPVSGQDHSYEVRLNDIDSGNPATITCTAEFAEENLNDRNTEVAVELDYEYTDTIRKEVALRKTSI